MRRFPGIFIYAVVAFCAISCSSTRPTSDASSSSGRKPHLADRVAHERQDLDRTAHTVVLEARTGTQMVATPPPAVPVSAGLVKEVPALLATTTDEVASVTTVAPQGVPGRSVGVRAASLVQGVMAPALHPPAGEGGGGTNVWAIVGFVCAFFLPLLGIIFSLIALSQIKKTGEKGRGLALAGLIIGIITLLIAISLLA